LNYLRTDYDDQEDKAKSFLMKLLKGKVIERYDLQTQAIEVFIDNNPENPRFLEVNLMFNMEREGLPTIHLTLPSEQTQTGGNGIGVDQGYQDVIVEDTEYDENGNMIFQGKITEVYTRRFQSTYNIVITSDNSNEVILIYHTLRALLISLIPSMSLAGLENVALGGQDVQLNSGLAPKNMYVRSITLTLQYETSSPSIFPQLIFNDLTAKGTPVNE
jgi:hypothetical protein